MTYPVSIFIMDVSNSSKEDIGFELSKYLQLTEERISAWTLDIAATKVIHRSGDEIVVVSSGYSTAYTLAFYISRIWPFKAHQPYFGLAFGDIQDDVSTLNLETWIHPLMKQARDANDALKQQGQARDQFTFKLADLINETSLEGYHFFRRQFETLLNTIVKLKQEQLNDQTAIQSLVCSLYLVLNQQNKVSEYLNRSKSTISSHMKKGKAEPIIHAFNDIVQVLNSLETERFQNPQIINNQLQNKLKRLVSNQLDDYFANK